MEADSRTVWLVLAAAAGAGLMALGFPPYSMYGLAWIALVPLLWGLFTSRTAGEAVLVSGVWGTVYGIATLYWLGEWAVWPVIFISVGYVPTWALWGVVVRNLAEEGPWWTVLGGAFGWTALEMGKQYGLWTIPLFLVSQTQVKNLPAIQIADITGQWGITFLVVAVNIGIAYYFWKAKNYDELAPAALVPGILFIAAFSYGAGQIQNFSYDNPRRPTYGETRRVALVQHGGGEMGAWLEKRVTETVNQYVEYTRERAGSDSPLDLVVFPEASVMVRIQRDSPKRWIPGEIYRLSNDLEASVLFGTSIIEPDPVVPRGERRYNGAQVVAPGNEPVANYGKNRPVPVGETRPMGPLVRAIDPRLGYQGFASFRSMEALPTGQGFDVGVSICFESLYPEISRHESLDGAGMLLDISNYSWFRDHTASDFNALVDVLRAVENRRFYLRASTEGYSQVVSFSGAIRRRNKDPEASHFIRTKVELNDDLTFYSRYGDWFAYLSLLVGAIVLVRLINRGAEGRGEKLVWFDLERLWP